MQYNLNRIRNNSIPDQVQEVLSDIIIHPNYNKHYYQIINDLHKENRKMDENLVLYLVDIYNQVDAIPPSTENNSTGL